MTTTLPRPQDPLNPTLDESAAAVQSLAANFAANAPHYLSPNYQEAEVRKDFIDKYLIALGWDVNHDVQKNPFQQEVKVERAVQVATAQKRADYALALAPNFDAPVLYVEAKKPAGDLATADNYFQTIRYAYQKAHPIAVLTDFEQLHILDARFKPNIDTALDRRLRKYHYSDYSNPEKFPEIFYTLSRPAVATGAISKFAATLPKPSGRPGQLAFLAAHQPVDESLLEELDDLRKLLARALKNRNPALDSSQLTELTQRILDRLVFMRFLEDKLIEPEHLIANFGLSGSAAEGEGWRDFLAASRRLDRTYNGIVFKHHPMLDSTPDQGGLTLEDKPFTDVINAFDHTRSPYLFNEIPIPILGSIYERFLGNVITATAKRADLEPKPEVRKAGGVYYTPQYIVDYIVDNTVGKLIASKTPDQIAALRFADIACGSGSFLLGIYDKLLKYYTAWYNAHPKSAPKSAVTKREGVFHLTLEEKSRILLNNLYGVDIDSQAVEVAQLSLYLKLLEEETTASARQFTLAYHRPLLPSLANNIKCGNSLIGTDYYNGHQLNLLDPEEIRRINAFDWKTEFRHILLSGGFDAILGNPPYVRMEGFKQIKPYLRTHFESHDERTDLYVYFIEQAHSLVKSGGAVGYIVSNKWVRSIYGERLRKAVLSTGTVRQLIDFGELPVFSGAATFPLVFITSKRPNRPTDDFLCVDSITREAFMQVASGAKNLAYLTSAFGRHLTHDRLSSSAWRLGDGALFNLLGKLRGVGVSLATYTEGKIRYGIKTGLVSAFIIDGPTAAKLAATSARARAIIKPYLVGDDVRKYHVRESDRFIIYTPHGVNMRGADAILRHLTPHKNRLQRRATKQEWYELQQPQAAYKNDYESPKIIFPDIAKESRFALDLSGRYPADTCFIIPLNDLFLLGILNSSLAWFFFRSVCPVLGDPQRGGRLRLKLNYVQQLPVARLDESTPNDKRKRTALASLVTTVLALHQQLPAARTDHARTLLQRQIAATDAAIDQLVYQLYTLTPEEIALVESASAPSPSTPVSST